MTGGLCVGVFCPGGATVRGPYVRGVCMGAYVGPGRGFAIVSFGPGGGGP